MSTLVKGGERIHAIGDTSFTLNGRFSDLKEIGRGSYGVVCSAHDETAGKRVAIKKIVPMAKHALDAKHVLREIRLMRHMGMHENVITLEDLIVRESADELYIVMELTDSDLHRVLSSKQTLSETHFRLFMHQLLCGVKYLHDNRIIHRDLKPGNLLVTRDCRLRITDFGLARERPTGKDDEDPESGVDTPMTEHVVTRWYRPPELMLCPDGLYTYAVDIWSCGCILGEMLGRRPLFPGKNFVHQLSLIFDVVGTPASADVGHIRNSQAIKFLESQRGKKRVPMSLVYPGASPEATALLEDMFLFKPDARIDVDAALRSAFLRGAERTAIGRSCMHFPPTRSDFEFSFERRKYSKYQLKEMIVNEASTFRATRARSKAEAERWATRDTREPDVSPSSENPETQTSPEARVVEKMTKPTKTTAAMTASSAIATSVSKYPSHSGAASRYAVREIENDAPSVTRAANEGDIGSQREKDKVAVAKLRADMQKLTTNRMGDTVCTSGRRVVSARSLTNPAAEVAGSTVRRKKQLTVPQSPQFTKTARQRRLEAAAAAAGGGGRGGESMARSKPTSVGPSGLLAAGKGMLTARSRSASGERRPVAGTGDKAAVRKEYTGIAPDAAGVVGRARALSASGKVRKFR